MTELQAHRCKANSILGFWQVNLAKWPWETQMRWHQRMELKHAVCQSRESSTLHSPCAAFSQSVKSRSRNTADPETANRDVKKQGRVHLRPCHWVTKRGEASHAPCQRSKGGGLAGRELGTSMLPLRHIWLQQRIRRMRSPQWCLAWWCADRASSVCFHSMTSPSPEDLKIRSTKVTPAHSTHGSWYMPCSVRESDFLTNTILNLSKYLFISFLISPKIYLSCN